MEMMVGRRSARSATLLLLSSLATSALSADVANEDNSTRVAK